LEKTSQCTIVYVKQILEADDADSKGDKGRLAEQERRENSNMA
jgi:hypothetical protein